MELAAAAIPMSDQPFWALTARAVFVDIGQELALERGTSWTIDDLARRMLDDPAAIEARISQLDLSASPLIAEGSDGLANNRLRDHGDPVVGRAKRFEASRVRLVQGSARTTLLGQGVAVQGLDWTQGCDPSDLAGIRRAVAPRLRHPAEPPRQPPERSGHRHRSPIGAYRSCSTRCTASARSRASTGCWHSAAKRASSSSGRFKAWRS